MPFKNMNDKTYFPSYKINYFTSEELVWSPHYESLFDIYIKYNNTIWGKLGGKKKNYVNFIIL